jgi:hypothetical protein
MMGLEDMSTHFLQRKNFRHGNTWSMERDSTIIQSRCDYIFEKKTITDTVWIADTRQQTQTNIKETDW